METPLATHVIVLNEITHPEHRRNGWRLCLQWTRYQYDDGTEPESGYRFIWRRPMGIAALGPKPRTTKPAPGHKIFPYLLRNLAIERPNHVWAADITDVPAGRGFLYLAAIID